MSILELINAILATIGFIFCAWAVMCWISDAIDTTKKRVRELEDSDDFETSLHRWQDTQKRMGE